MLTKSLRRRGTLAAVPIALALAAAGSLAAGWGPGGTRVTAHFTAAIGVYPGSDVRVLGVKVGTIDSVEPEGTGVRTTMTVDHGVDVPAGARAIVVAPSLVADRYIQLTPAYTGGPKLAGGTVIPVQRTATPMELDKLYDSVKNLSTQLGPEGVNKNGALSRVLDTGAANLRGNGQALRTTIEQFGQVARTLTDSKDDLFGTITDLQKFMTMLKNNDGQVRTAERQLADVTGFLAEDKENLEAALRELARALVLVKDFIEDNRALLSANINKLASITQVLVDQRRALAEALDVQPLNVGNVLNAYDPATRTLMGRGNLNELTPTGPPLPLPAAGPTQPGSGG
ncbi:ABC transporter substrate-binding protein [Actinomadura craniellae]|uniref:ABC transporter substrate-binding protein n=1 Tax=Actinomadura craniellae TaxID=2231787 RepID=A0A365GW90_9ACTN|nr:MCE family protein [Actinomadura craniellae]RAY11028.1 ABC transporter substrate-binding protein [Actinomadura craniellae]